MSMFAARRGIVVKQSNRNAEFFSRPANIIATVVKSKGGYSTKPSRSGQPFLLVTFRVEQVIDGDLRVGEERAWWKPLQGEFNMRDVLCLAGALLDVDPNEPTDEDLYKLFVGDESKGIAPQALGMRCVVEAVENSKGTINKATGTPFLNYYFGAVPDDTADVDAGF